MKIQRTGERGMSLAESLMALAILSVVIGFSVTMLGTAQRGTQDNLNKQFATQKAISMLEELKAVIQTQNGPTGTVLDAFDDGVTNNPFLTTQRGLASPADPASGNTRMGPRWLFERRITVQRMSGINNLRLVNVKVFVNDAGGTRLLAEVASVLSTIAQASPPTQVYDIYLVAIENVPGWWVYMQNVVPFVDSAMQGLEARHPGLSFRRHWIRKLSYGRDPYYTPYVNETADSKQPINSVYFYPGLMPAGSAVDNYYPPDFFTGRVKVDATLKNGYNATLNPRPYALADQYNNAMRYEDELALFRERVSLGLETADQPTLRLLMDDMYMHPGNYRNAIVINLHGELFPFPPVRNYSDAAKDPAVYPNVRAVTHPERLHYGNGDPVKLRVYSYSGRHGAAVPDWLGKNTGLSTPITVVLKNFVWTPSPNDVEAITGGVDFDGNGSPDPYSPPAPASTLSATTVAPTHMWWSSQIQGGDTVISLYNSPLIAPCVQDTNPCDRGGLSPASSLYGLEYIPSPVEDFTDPAPPAAFSTTLATPGEAEKNTARWIITIPSSLLPTNHVFAFETRIGDDLTTGTAVVPPADGASNLSRTYVWRGDNAWTFGDATHDPALPITERFQILGDPRHCPYADLKAPHGGSGLTNADPLGMGYNRYFDDFQSGSTNALTTWPGYSYVAPPLAGDHFGIKNNSGDTDAWNDGWNTRDGMLEIDVPRIYEILRSGLLRSNAVYTTMTGFSYYYVGLGDEIGYDSANLFDNSIPVSEKPFNGGSGWRYEQSITNATINSITGGVKYIRENSPGAGYWWAMTWLGELYPDSAFGGATGWKLTGNLPTGTGGGTFSRVLRANITPNLPAGTSFVNAVRRTQEEGSTTFFWTGTANSTFHHRYQDNTQGTLDADGQVIAQTYHTPLATTVRNARPFDINIDDTSMNPDHFLQAVYGPALGLRTLARYYRHTTNIQGSSLLAMTNGNATGQAAFVVVNGLSETGESGTAFISRWSFLSLIQSFFSAGLFATGGNPDPARVHELPRVLITNPNNNVNIVDPATLNVTWTAQYQRWDGIPYTPSYPANFTDSVPVSFALLYSRDNGATWLHMQDNTQATPGVPPVDPALTQATTTYAWNVPSASFPQGNYVIRIEAYRQGFPLHYSFHQYTAFIKR